MLEIPSCVLYTIREENWKGRSHWIQGTGLITHVQLHKRYFDIECKKISKKSFDSVNLSAIFLLFINSLFTGLKPNINCAVSFGEN